MELATIRRFRCLAFPPAANLIRAFPGTSATTGRSARISISALGLHYIRDTGRSDSQLGPYAAINAFGQGLGDAVHQPNLNFAPQVGIAWDPWKSGKTVIRAGGGIYYENTVWNNVLFDAPARLQTRVVLELCRRLRHTQLLRPADWLGVPANCRSAAGVPGGDPGCRASGQSCLYRKYP